MSEVIGQVNRGPSADVFRQLSKLIVSERQWIIIGKHDAAFADSTAVLRWIVESCTGSLYNFIDDGLKLDEPASWMVDDLAVLDL